MKYRFLTILFSIILCGCMDQPSENYASIAGKTMGTYYKVTYKGEYSDKVQEEVDQLLFEVNMSTSTYIDSSLISRFNQSTDTFHLGSYDNNRVRYFVDNYNIARIVYDMAEGFYDPTVMPLVNYWGFGYDPQEAVTEADSNKVEELLARVGMNEVRLINKEDTYLLVKDNPGSALDFSSVAKGYAIDVIAEYMEENSVFDYYIDIGGEARANGKKAGGEAWKSGISTPDPSAAMNDIFAVLRLDSISIATSGNYRNYYDVDGIRYGHTINPMSGYPESSEILSASILARECALADAWATACMAMGWQRAIEKIRQYHEVEGLLIYNEGGKYKTITTDGFNNYLLNKKD